MANPGFQLDKMQIWIEIRDSVGFMFRAEENPVEVIPLNKKSPGIKKTVNFYFCDQISNV